MNAGMQLAMGLVVLVLGAEVLVRGASRLALAIGVPPLIIGLTVVAYGTSAPELSVTTMAALAGRPDIALGNVVGSNIFNVLFILGISALILPLRVSKQLVRRDVPLMIVAAVVFLLMALDGRVGRGDGLVLVLGVVWYTVHLIRGGRREVLSAEEEAGVKPARTPLLGAGIAVVVGLALLVLGARWLVDGATAIARQFGMSELVIGLTIVAGGTSLPELATSLMAAIRGERDLAVGNIVGSNIFNILMIMGAAGLLSGVTVAPGALHFDIPIMIAVSLACLPVFFTFGEINRLEGAFFLLYYGAYVVFLFLMNSSHDGIQAFSRFMLLFVGPVTLLALVLSLWQWHQYRARGGAQTGAAPERITAKNGLDGSPQRTDTTDHRRERT